MGQQDTSRSIRALSSALSTRALLIARPCLIVEHLREALAARGIETFAASFDQPISTNVAYDACVAFQQRCETHALVLIKRRIDELRETAPSLPTVALIEDHNAEAADFAGFTTVMIGLPSMAFVIEVIMLLVTTRKCEQLDEINLDARFTPRESELLDLLRNGMSNKLIAHRLGVSMSTVKSHMHNVMMKLKATNRTEVVASLHRSAT